MLSPSEIIKLQPKAWSLLSGSFKAERVASTYLFTGPQGRGAWPLALCLAALVNCEHPVDEGNVAVPCGECAPCRNIFALNYEGLQIVTPIGKHKNEREAIDLLNEILAFKREHPFDNLVAEKSTTIPIDLARMIKSSLSRKGTEGVTRVALFFQMEQMRASSADALLKLIEEPPSNTILILTAERAESLLPTIQSRSQRIRLDRIAATEMMPVLTESFGLSPDRAQMVARLADGDLGRALELSDEEDGSAEERAVGMLLFKSLLTRDTSDTVSQMFQTVDVGNRAVVERLLALWQSLLRDCAYFAGTGDEGGLVNADLSDEIKRLSVGIERVDAVTRVKDLIKNALADMQRNVHIQAALASLVIQMHRAIKQAEHG